MVEQFWEERQVTHQVSGQTSTLEIKRAVLKYQSDWRFDDLNHVIYDFSTCSGITIHPGDIEEIAAISGAAGCSNPRIRITVITEHPEVIQLAQAYASSSLSLYPLTIYAPATNRIVREHSPRETLIRKPAFCY